MRIQKTKTALKIALVGGALLAIASSSGAYNIANAQTKEIGSLINSRKVKDIPLPERPYVEMKIQINQLDDIPRFNFEDNIRSYDHLNGEAYYVR